FFASGSNSCDTGEPARARMVNIIEPCRQVANTFLLHIEIKSKYPAGQALDWVRVAAEVRAYQIDFFRLRQESQSMPLELYLIAKFQYIHQNIYMKYRMCW